MSNENLETLRLLTHELPPVPIDPGDGERGFYRYPTKDGIGTVIGWKLLAKDGIAVAHFFMSEGADYPEHGHEDSKEFILVYSGALEVRSDDPLACVHFKDKTAVVRSGGCVCFEKQQVHSAKALEDTWFVAVTIPRDEAYPK